MKASVLLKALEVYGDLDVCVIKKTGPMAYNDTDHHKAVDATDETITLSNGLGYNGYKKASIFRFISFKELKDMAIERLTKSLEQHQKMYEEL